MDREFSNDVQYRSSALYGCIVSPYEHDQITCLGFRGAAGHGGIQKCETMLSGEACKHISLTRRYGGGVEYEFIFGDSCQHSVIPVKGLVFGGIVGDAENDDVCGLSDGAGRRQHFRLVFAT